MQGGTPSMKRCARSKETLVKRLKTQNEVSSSGDRMKVDPQTSWPRGKAKPLKKESETTSRGDRVKDDSPNIDKSEESDIRNNKTGSSNLIVVLDLDKCLISRFRDGEEWVMHYRPGLKEFLKFVTGRFETHIFTASTKKCADLAMDELCLLVENQNAFSKRWYSDDCETLDFGKFGRIWVKPLSKVAEWAGRDAQDLRKIVHVDDDPTNFLLNHNNGIVVPPWSETNLKDKALWTVTETLLEIESKGVEDVRTYIQNDKMLEKHLSLMDRSPPTKTKGLCPSFFH